MSVIFVQRFEELKNQQNQILSLSGTVQVDFIFKTIEDKYHHNSERQTQRSIDEWWKTGFEIFILYCRNSLNLYNCVTAMLDWKDENTQSLDNKFILYDL